MSKRPPLYLIQGSLTPQEHKLYHLRDPRSQQAPAQEPWPKAGAWRDLVHKLVRNPIKDE